MSLADRSFLRHSALALFAIGKSVTLFSGNVRRARGNA